jgi:hypothetical protein
VYVEVVCRDTSASYTSARRAWISPVVNPFADSEITMSSTPDRRRCRLRTICGAKQPSRSRHVDLDRADLGQHRLCPSAVAMVAANLAPASPLS